MFSSLFGSFANYSFRVVSCRKPQSMPISILYYILVFDRLFIFAHYMEQFRLLYWVAIKVNLKFSSCCCRTEVDKKHTHYKRCRDVALSLHFRQGQNNFILFHAEIYTYTMYNCWCASVCACTLKWTRVLSSELIVNLLRRSCVWRRGGGEEETGDGRGMKGMKTDVC